MGAIKITVTNSFFPGIVETFHCIDVDLNDLQEVEYCAEECMGQYLDMHGDLIYAKTPDVDSEVIAEACDYMIEEVIE